MKRIGHIIRGWAKHFGFISITRAEEKLSALRMKECKKCTFSEPKKILVFLNGHAEKQASLACTKCNCPCLEKSLVVDEQCPIGIW